MGRSDLWAVLFGLALALGAAAVVIAHDPGEAEIVVEPASVTAGDAVVLAGTGLEPDSDRVLVLAGEDLIIEFGTVTTDDEGMFQAELTIPSHLPSGTYEFRAIGDETLTVPLAISGAAASPPTDAGETIMPRDRAPLLRAIHEYP